MDETLRIAIEVGARKLGRDLADHEHLDCARFAIGVRLWLLMLWTYQGKLTPYDWDVGWYLQQSRLPEVRRALMELMPQA